MVRLLIASLGPHSRARYSTNDEDVDNWLYTFPNILAVFAAGNFGQTQGTTNAPGVQLASPAVAKNVLSVGASQNDLASIISMRL